MRNSSNNLIGFQVTKAQAIDETAKPAIIIDAHLARNLARPSLLTHSSPKIDLKSFTPMPDHIHRVRLRSQDFNHSLNVHQAIHVSFVLDALDEAVTLSSEAKWIQIREKCLPDPSWSFHAYAWHHVLTHFDGHLKAGDVGIEVLVWILDTGFFSLVFKQNHVGRYLVLRIWLSFHGNHISSRIRNSHL
jgi:hypothetical protein